MSDQSGKDNSRPSGANAGRNSSGNSNPHSKGPLATGANANNHSMNNGMNDLNNNINSNSHNNIRSATAAPANRFLLSPNPNPQRNSPIPSRPSGLNGLKDDLANQRFFLSSPMDVFPLPSAKHDATSAAGGKNEPKMYPDFFPWRKSKEEDSLAVDYVPRGYHQPAEVSNESGSACTSMLPLFKQWTSTPALSYFLVKSMHTREKISRINTASTFKPPPRVTLTDQKREAWLKDLASPAIPLRKLSRTIPHGIRNKALLEQCYLKKIPISRAVWFARCVGANELRGLKRKGVNASSAGLTDSIWIKDWTLEVIDYLEKSANSASSAQLELTTTNTTNIDKELDKLDYLTRFTGYLFMESLLDHHTFLSWVLKYLTDASLQSLPVALMYARMYWSYFIKSQPMSQYLAKVLIQQYSSVMRIRNSCGGSSLDSNSDSAFQEVVDILRSYMKELFVISPNSFVIPRLWGEIGPILEEALVDITSLVDTVRLRNEALSVSNSIEARLAKRPNFTLVEKLDGIQSTSADFTQVAKSLIFTSQSQHEILPVVFNWATCTGRKKVDTVYTTVALCEVWASKESKMNWNISSSFIDFLIGINDDNFYVMDKIYLLATELLRNGMFSMGDYFRKLISMGLLFIERYESHRKVQVMLLQNLPMHYSGVNFEQQRNVLLNRAKQNFQPGPEPEQIVVELLGFLFVSTGAGSVNADDAISGASGRQDVCCTLTTRTENELKQLLGFQKCLVSEKIVTELENRLDSDNDFYLSLEQAAVYVKVLEVLGDYRALYHSIWLLVPRIHSCDVLYFLANVLKNFRACFGALGQLPDLIHLFVKQFNNLKVKARLSKSLADLIKFTLDEFVGLKPELKLELESFLRIGNGPSPAADSLSPMSDISAITSPTSGDPLLVPFGITEIPDSRTLPSVVSSVGNLLLNECAIEQDIKDMARVRSLAAALQYLRGIDYLVYDETFASLFSSQLNLQPDADAEHVVNLAQFIAFCLVYECIPLEKVKINLPLVEYHNSENYFGFNLVEQMSFDVQCSSYKKTEASSYWEDVYRIIICKTSSSAYKDIFPIIAEFLEETACCRSELFFDKLVYPLVASKDVSSITKLLELTKNLLLITPATENAGVDGGSFESCVLSLLAGLNSFNLSLSQGTLCLLVEHQRLIHPNLTEKFCDIFLHCMAKSQSSGVNPSVFGDLVLKLNPQDLSMLLDRCENVFLKSQDVPLVVVEGENVVPELLEVVDATAQFQGHAVSQSCDETLASFMELLVVRCETFSNSNGANDTNDTTEIPTETATDTGTETTSASDLVVGILLLIKIIMIRFQRNQPGNDQFAQKVLDGLLHLQRLCVGDARFQEISGVLVDCVNVIQKEMEQEINISGSGSGPNSSSGAKTNVPMLIGFHETESVLSSDDNCLSGLALYDKAKEAYSNVNVRAFDLLEDANPTVSINDVPLDLSLFHASVDRKNPR